MHCRRNRISFDFFGLHAWLILRVLLAWFWLMLRLWGSPSPSNFHLDLSYTVSVHPFSSLHTSSSPFPRTFPSAICLSDTCWVFILALHCIQKTPKGIWCSEVHHLRIRIVSQGVVCVHCFFGWVSSPILHLIYLFVCIICLSGTWWVSMFELHKIPYSSKF